VWQSVVNGQTLKFRLAGINNQNFIMRDEETGSWWQQVSGEAIQGAFKGQRLEAVDFDELSFGIWKRENPGGRVLRPEPGKVESADWEAQVARMPVRVSQKLDDALEPRALVVGITINGKAKAYPFSALEKQSPILDTLDELSKSSASRTGVSTRISSPISAVCPSISSRKSSSRRFVTGTPRASSTETGIGTSTESTLIASLSSSIF